MSIKKPTTTPKQDAFARAVVKNSGDTRKAYLEVNPDATKSTLDTMPHRWMKDPAVKDTIAYYMTVIGFDKPFYAKKLGELINKKKPLVIKDTIHMVDDNEIQYKSTIKGIELTGELQRNTNTPTIQHNTQYNFKIDNGNVDKVDYAITKLSKIYNMDTIATNKTT